MPTTQSTKMALEHILDVIFSLQADSALHKALSHNAYTIPEDFLMEKDKDLDDLEYPDDQSISQRIPKGHAGLLKMFKQFIAYKSNQGATLSDDDDWRALTQNLQQFQSLPCKFCNSYCTKSGTCFIYYSLTASINRYST